MTGLQLDPVLLMIIFISKCSIRLQCIVGLVVCGRFGSSPKWARGVWMQFDMVSSQSKASEAGVFMLNQMPKTKCSLNFLNNTSALEYSGTAQISV